MSSLGRRPWGFGLRDVRPLPGSRETDTAPAVAWCRFAAMSVHLFAGLRVRELEAARPWYERLLGEPTLFPHATEAVWTLAEDRSVYVVEHASAAGNCVVTIFVDDLDARVDTIAACGLEPHERLTLSNGVRKALYRDPDGNELGFAGAPLGSGS
jgi:catechol 2,3-dioxygenase-like lactoylglutathione lyase family enzyme